VPVFFPIIARLRNHPALRHLVVRGRWGLGLFIPRVRRGFFSPALSAPSVEGAARAYVPYSVVLLAGLLLVAFVRGSP